MSKTPNVKKVGRYWRQKLCRILVATGMLLAAAYITLPWWVPSGLIRQRIIDQMSEQLGLGVHIDEVSLSWGQGVELRGLKIDSPEGFSAGSGKTMVSAAVIRCELSPINLFFRKRIAWMEVEHPVVNVEVDADGNVNIGALSNLKSDAQTGRISVRNAEVNILLSGHDQRLVLGVQDMQFIAGRARSFGRVTMSAELRQDKSEAPVALCLDTVPDANPISAMAAFNFANVDMAQLNLVEILGLPLRKLAGRCSGSLNLQANDDGRIDRGVLNLTVRKLDLQPLDEKIKLPVVGEAGFRISASYDPVSQCVDLQPFSVRVPGLDMSGTGRLFSETLDGNWQGISRLKVAGEISPMQFVAMLTGTNKLPGNVDVSGPVRFDVELSREGSEVDFTGTIDATAADFRRGKRVVKPPKRKLRAELKATLDERTFGIDVRQWWIYLGDNIFTGQGEVHDVRKVLAGVQDDSPALALNALSNWQWKGRAELRDLDSLRSLGSGIEQALEGMKLTGYVVGDISIDSRDGLVVQGSLDLPAETVLTGLAGVQKTAGRAVRLSLRATGDHKSSDLDDVEFRLTVGDGRVVFDRGRVRFVGPDPKAKNGSLVDISGDFSIAGIEHILTGLCPKGIPGVTASGSMAGNYIVRLSPEANRLHLAVSDMSALGFRLDKTFHKRIGAKASGSLDFISDRRALRGMGNVLRCSWREDQADLRGQVSFASDSNGPRASGSLRADIRDARWLAWSSPRVSKLLGPGWLGGAMVLTASADWTPGRLRGQAHCDADALVFKSTGRNVRLKSAGVPLQVYLDGELSTGDKTQMSTGQVDVKVLFGNNYAKLNAEVDVVSKIPEVVTIKTWPEVVPRCRMRLAGRLDIDETITDLVPELDAEIKRLGLGGHGDFTASLDASDRGLGVSVNIDADNVSFALGKKFVKPAGLAAGATAAMQIPVDFSRVRLNDLRAHAGGLHVLAAGSVVPVRSGNRLRIDPKDMHITVWTRQAEMLEKMIPGLKPYKISGDAVAEGQWTGGLDGSMPYLTVNSSSLSGCWRGREVKVSGALAFKDIARNDQRRWVPDGVETSNLQMRAGKNHAWLLLDLKKLSSSPTGTFTLLGRHLDTRDLRQWLGGPKPKTPPVTTAGKDTDKDKESDVLALARERAKKLIVSQLPMLRATDIKGTAQISHLRLWNEVVSQYYDLLDMKLLVSADHGLIETTYAGGLNGGSVRGGVKIDLKADPPAGQPVMASIWQDIRNVAARENIQPQLALFFPGNTVYGMFNRRQDVKLSVEDLVASTIDSSISVYPVGTAKTVTIDGMTQGRAAPTFVTALFPGLNMTSYRYLKMTAFSELQADGGAYSDMIFNGQTYDMYIEGTTDANKIGRYQIGLILIGTPQTPEWNHAWRQGRLPILKFQARIEGGKMHDVSVSYPWPNESLGEILLKNNILYRAFLATQRK
ncbi:MAG: hypothetical protein GY794_18105 [bacterium]|nr:hypothetical protein [bacterium]